jgi:hypothetical protein
MAMPSDVWTSDERGRFKKKANFIHRLHKAALLDRTLTRSFCTMFPEIARRCKDLRWVS